MSVNAGKKIPGKSWATGTSSVTKRKMRLVSSAAGERVTTCIFSEREAETTGSGGAHDLYLGLPCSLRMVCVSFQGCWNHQGAWIVIISAQSIPVWVRSPHQPHCHQDSCSAYVLRMLGQTPAGQVGPGRSDLGLLIDSSSRAQGLADTISRNSMAQLTGVLGYTVRKQALA